MMIDEPSIQILPPVAAAPDIVVEDGPPDPTPAAPPIMDVSNAVQFVQEPFTVNPDGSIDCMIHHDRFGWIPFTASPNDPETHGRVIHEALAAHLGIA